jgi:hypothetical protein
MSMQCEATTQGNKRCARDATGDSVDGRHLCGIHKRALKIAALMQDPRPPRETSFTSELIQLVRAGISEDALSYILQGWKQNASPHPQHP